MKYLLFSLSILCSTSLFSQESDYDAVVRTLKYYTEGGTNNDWDTFKQAFHETATMKCLRDGKYTEVNALEFFSGMKPGPPSDRHTRIANVEIFGNAASAQIILMYKEAYVCLLYTSPSPRD